MTTPRELATVRDYDGLHAAFRSRASELQVTREAIDAVSGLQEGYAAKLLAPVPIRMAAKESLGPLLAALGLVLIVAEDAETLAKITKRMAKRRKKERVGTDAGTTMLAQRRHKRRRFLPFKEAPEFAKIARAQQLLRQNPRQRQSIAKKAARARWAGHRPKRQKAPEIQAI